MKTTKNNNGTTMANNNGTNAAVEMARKVNEGINNGTIQNFVLSENVKFDAIPAVYTFGDYLIFVESKTTGKVHGEKTTYSGVIIPDETIEGLPIIMNNFDITKIKKIVGCNFKRVYISNMDGTTIPKCKELTNDMIEGMVLSLSQRLEKQYNTLLQTMLQGKTDGEQFAESTHNFISAFNIAKVDILQNYRKELEKEQLRISIENKEKEQKRSAKKAVSDAKNIDTTTAEGLLKAQLIEAMMAGDFEKVAAINQRLQTMQSK